MSDEDFWDEINNPQDDRPSLEDLRQWRSSLIGERGGLDDAQEREKRLYFQEFSQIGFKNARVVKTGSAPADADSAVDTLVPVDIQIRVTPARAARKKYVDQAELLTRFGQAQMRLWRKKKDPIRRIANDMVLRRLGITRVLLDDVKWKPLPDGPLDDDEDEAGDSAAISWNVRNRRKSPIVFERRDPRYVAFRDDDDGTMLVVVEHYPTTVLEARVAFAQYPKAVTILGLGRDPKEVIWVSDIWYGAYRAILLEDRPIFDGDILEHGYAEIPYRYAGFRELPFDDWEERFRGMLTNAGDLYPMESQVLGMHIDVLKWNAWRTFKGWTLDHRQLDITPGQYVEIDIRKGEYLELMQGEPVPPEILQTASVMDSYIQRNGVSQGPSTAEGSRSGQMIWAIQAIRQMKIESARQALLELVTGSLELATMIVECKLDGKLTLPLPGLDRDGKARGEVTISGDDVNGYWDGWDVSFGKRLDPAMLEQAKALSALAANNWMPLKTSWEMSGLAETASQWEEDLYLQAIDRLPFLLQLAGLERVIGYYGEEDWRTQVFQQQIQASMGPSPDQAAPGGAPGMATGGTMQAPSMIGPAMAQGGASVQPTGQRGKTRGSRTPGGGAGPAPPPGM